MPIKSPTLMATRSTGRDTTNMVQMDWLRRSKRLRVVSAIFGYLLSYRGLQGNGSAAVLHQGTLAKLFRRLRTTRFQPSAMTKSRILKGREIIMGGSIIIPIASRTLETTMSTTIKGI